MHWEENFVSQMMAFKNLADYHLLFKFKMFNTEPAE